MKYLNLKNEIKELAQTIKELKSHRKQDNRGDWSIYSLDYKISGKKKECRHKHIAYCLLRGRKYEEIEKPASDNKADFTWINTITEQHRNEANVCIGS